MQQGRRARIKRRIVGALIPEECAERSPECLPHLRRFDLVRRRFKHATKHEIGDMREGSGVCELAIVSPETRQIL